MHEYTIIPQKMVIGFVSPVHGKVLRFIGSKVSGQEQIAVQRAILAGNVNEPIPEPMNLLLPMFHGKLFHSHEL